MNEQKPERLEVVLSVDTTDFDRRLKLVAEIMRVLADAQRFEQAVKDLNRVIQSYEDKLRGEHETN